MVANQNVVLGKIIKSLLEIQSQRRVTSHLKLIHVPMELVSQIFVCIS